MPITSVKVWPLKKDHPKVKANASFAIDEKIAVKCSIMQGEKGLWVKLPGHFGEKEGKKEWYDDVVPLSKEARQEIVDAVLNQYRTETSGSPASQGDASGPTDQSGEQVPFG